MRRGGGVGGLLLSSPSAAAGAYGSGEAAFRGMQPAARSRNRRSSPLTSVRTARMSRSTSPDSHRDEVSTRNSRNGWSSGSARSHGWEVSAACTARSVPRSRAPDSGGRSAGPTCRAGDEAMAISSIEINGVVAAGAGGAASGGAAGGGAAAVGGGAGSSSVITSRGVGGGGCGSGSFSFGRGVDTGVADGVEEVDAPADRLLFLLRRRLIKSASEGIRR